MKFLIGLLVAAKMYAALPEQQANNIANAIYFVEGAGKTRHPYGIKSINTRGNANVARKICITTIQNTHNRWLAENKPIPFLDYLANRYCPMTVDPAGNKNWKRNIRKFVGEI